MNNLTYAYLALDDVVDILNEANDMLLAIDFSTLTFEINKLYELENLMPCLEVE